MGCINQTMVHVDGLKLRLNKIILKVATKKGKDNI